MALIAGKTTGVLNHFQNGHLVVATLVESGSFSNFEQCFPTRVMEFAAKSCLFLGESKQHFMLPAIYGRPEFRQCLGAVPLL